MPITYTSINDKLGMDEAEAPAHVTGRHADALWHPGSWPRWGEAESAEFHRQSTIMVDIWNRAGVETELRSEPQANHFTIIDPLTDPDSSLTSVLVDLVNETG